MTTNNEWIDKAIQELVKEFGVVPPPWQLYPDEHPYSIHWRMGKGEGRIWVFNQWWNNQNWDEEQRINYFRQWPPPPRWLQWMIGAIWDIDSPGEVGEEFVYAPYFNRVEQLGFGTKAEFESDINDPKWLADDI